jgi:hypothetical protein
MLLGLVHTRGGTCRALCGARAMQAHRRGVSFAWQERRVLFPALLGSARLRGRSLPSFRWLPVRG